ncbi:MAG: toxin-antitoxin system HicB family antitoxin [Acidobacteria bacterium]|nr:toxin-antitoxin system HicB family antitoxin [Acidobacteriota bacterium]MBA4183850.1 toxin-antitoxin system HicB family antitoxin [Acidobacteriota bacterium]
MNKKTNKKANKENLPKVEQYLYSVGWSEEDEAFVARAAEFPSLAAHGDTLENALREIKTVVKFVLQDLEETGEFVPEPFGKRSFSGRLVLRMPEYLHRKLALESMQQGVSLNQLLNLKLEAKS